MQSPIHHSKTKHIDIQHHYVREMVSANMINFEYVSSVKMVIEMLTKIVFREKHIMCMEMLDYNHLRIDRLVVVSKRKR